MATTAQSRAEWVLITGVTGFVGQALAGTLLDHGYRLLCLLRADTPSEARARLVAALKPWGQDAEGLLEAGRLLVLRSDLCAPRTGLAPAAVERLRGSIASVVHAAGNTTFRTRPDGEPARTNVEGTREVFNLAAACECRDWHLISTAYVCGRCARSEERLHDAPPPFHNEYEHSKWRSEVESERAAESGQARLTIYRPSIVVGHSRTGLCTRFSGVYYLFRAISLLARAVEQRGDVDRRQIPLRICADARARVNLVFVDDLAREFVDLFTRPDARGGIYHLTHPDPPDNAWVKRIVEAYYDVAGGHFVGGQTRLPEDERSAYEGIFAEMTEAIAPYLFASPDFDRTRTDRYVNHLPTAWTDERLRRLISWAESVNWRHGPRDVDPHAEWDGFDRYFERFLPERYARSRVGRLRQIDVDVRFWIDGGRDGDWWCRFRGGRLTRVQRTVGQAADLTYRATPAAFWRTVSGEATAAELFLAGDAHVEGDIERGLKFATVLQEFVREHPCHRKVLLADETRTT